MDAQPTPLAGLSGTLHDQFTDWLDRRKPQEEEMLRAYRDNMRIATDDDTKDVGTSKAQKSKIFIGSTRGKIRSARAKIKDALFGSDKMPFDTRPSSEDLKDFADTMEAILSWQFEEARLKQALGTGIDTICTYGTGFIFGPFVKNKSHVAVSQDNSQGYPQLQEKQHDYPCPYYEHARTMDVYPDPEAEDVREGNGVYWASRKSVEFIRSLKGQAGYSDEAISRALQEKVTSYTDEGSDRTAAARQNLYRYTKEGRIWFTRYFGLVKKKELADWRNSNAQTEIEQSDSDDDAETVEAIVIIAGGQVIKADENPYKDKKRPALRCVYEDVEHEMWGVGIAKNNDPHQRVVNSAFRLYIEGKAFALLKTCSIDRSKFEVTEDFKLFPGKKFQMKTGLTPEDRKTAIMWHDMVDVTEGWEKVIEMSEQFSDDDTAITKYTQGDDSRHLNDTATGISMIMNAASLPLKEVISHVDEMWIEEIIEGLIDWDLQNLEPEIVRVMVGKKEADIWTAIKQYGKTSFMEWFATGSSTFMAKEVLMHKLQGFLQLILSAPEVTLPHIDIKELLQQTWDAGEIGKESPILDEEDKKGQPQQMPPELQKLVQDTQQKAEEIQKQEQDLQSREHQLAQEAQQVEAAKQDLKHAQEMLKARDQMMKEVEKAQETAKQAEIESTVNNAINKVMQLVADNEREMQSLMDKLTLQEKTAAKDGETEQKSAETESKAADSKAMLSLIEKMHKDNLEMMQEVQQALVTLAAPREAIIKRQPNGDLKGQLVVNG